MDSMRTTIDGARSAGTPADGGARTWPSWLARLRRRARGDGPPALVDSLRLLAQLRWIAIAGQSAAIAAAVALGVRLPVAAMAAVVAALAGFAFVAGRRVRAARPATHGEVAAHLAFDLLAFTLLLALAGGTANPFVLLYVLHVVLVAQLLPWPLAVAGTALAGACYALAALTPWPLRMAGGDALPPALAAFGEYTAFVLTALLTGVFVARIAAALRQREALLRDVALKASRDECVLRIGALAAGAAHELASPLQTMAVIAGDMKDEADASALRRDAGVIAAQVDACRRTLANLTAAAAHARGDASGRVPLDRFVDAAVERFQALRPDASLACRWDGALPVPEIAADAALAQAILILLNNAADASMHDVNMIARWDDASFDLTVQDRGPGLPEGVRARLGRVFHSTKPPGHGTGLGLVLAADAVQRLSGTLRFANRAGGGASVELSVPIAALTAAADPAGR